MLDVWTQPYYPATPAANAGDGAFLPDVSKTAIGDALAFGHHSEAGRTASCSRKLWRTSARQHQRCGGAHPCSTKQIALIPFSPPPTPELAHESLSKRQATSSPLPVHSSGEPQSSVSESNAATELPKRFFANATRSSAYWALRHGRVNRAGICYGEQYGDP